jgi:pimeloyl-ACP methyl ester carboxylesterase
LLTAMQKFIIYTIKKALGLYINILSYISPEKATTLAYKFFSEPRDGRLNHQQLPVMLKEARAEMVTYNDFIFQTYTWEGNDTKVLLIHGWESNSWRWEQFLPYLKQSGCTIVAIDAPAHGLSHGTEFNIPTYAAFVNVVVQKLQPQYLVGHSLGGATALYYMSHYPDNSIEKLISLGAPCDLNTILHNYMGMLSLNGRVLKLMQKHFFENFKIKTHEFSGSLFASRIKIPGMLVHDVEDDIVTFAEAQKIADAWPEAEFVVTKGLGHSLHDDKLYRKMYNFLFQHEHSA